MNHQHQKDRLLKQGDFPPAWIDYGLLTEASAAAIYAARHPDYLDDPNTEHWRWILFLYYYQQPNIDSALIEKLAAVAKVEPLKELNISMKVELLRLSACPQSIIDEAESSPLKPLRKAFDARVLREQKTKSST